MAYRQMEPMDHLSSYFRPHYPVIVAIVLLHVTGAFIQLELINITMPLINDGVHKHDIDLVFKLGAVMLGMVIVFALDRLAVSYLSSRVTGKVIKEVRKDLYRSLIHSKNVGRAAMDDSMVMTTMTSDVSAMEDYIMAVLNMHMFIPILMVGLLISTAAVDIRFGIVMLAVLVSMVIAVSIAGKHILPAYAMQQEKLDRVNDILKENFMGSRTIRAEGRTEYQLEKFDKANEEYGGMNRKVNLSTHYMEPLTTAVLNITVVLVYAAFVLEANQEFMGAGSMLVLFQYVTYFLLCASIIPLFSVVVPRMVPLAARINSIITESAEVTDTDLTGRPDPTEDVVLSMEGVSIVKGTNNKAFGVDMIVRKGETVAVVGNGVSGKDDIPAAVLGFASVSEGTIRIGGTDITAMPRKEVVSYVSYVADRAQMFRDTFRNNIDPYGTCTEKRMERALKASKFGEVAAGCPEGLDTIVTNEGNSISGGQRQKLAIARCLAKESGLYIFDRCMYSLDTESKVHVIEGIKEIASDSAVLVITDNVSLVRNFDRIYVMKGGRMIASGDDGTLMRECGLYRSLLQGDGGIQ